MKYYKSEVGKIEGPEKPLTFIGDRQEISEEEFTKILDEFFSDTENKQAVVVETTRKLALDYLMKGESVTIDDVMLSVKK